ncbi:MAG: divergent polysaccharide deacetylase family protein [Candidatus Tantalella remota]|nr:divergent polysaccharide deacetylase family protein [Candidatus Tantalella remota]
MPKKKITTTTKKKIKTTAKTTARKKKKAGISRRDILVGAASVVLVMAIVVISYSVGYRRGATALPSTAVPVAAKKGPSIALVLDDFGYTKKNLNAFAEVGVPMTLAVLPNLSHSKEVCSFAKKNGMEVILHLPMAPEKNTGSLEKDTVSDELDRKDVKRVMANAFRSVPGATGASNHMGSKATKDVRVMNWVIADIKERNLYFLDSLTTGESVCRQVALGKDVPYAVRDVFLDNELDSAHIEAQMKKLVRIAKKNGYAVGIGHDRAVTAKVLADIVPGIEKKGVRFVTLSELIRESKR